LNILLVGWGSIGKRHHEVLASLPGAPRIDVVTSQPDCPHRVASRMEDLGDLDSYDYFVIATETHRHYGQLAYLLERARGKAFLVEKPLFHEVSPPLALGANRVYCGYNLRFHPILLELRKRLEGRRILSANIQAGQYLPQWRPGRDYRTGYGADPKKGGGVLRDLSHEIDYAQWLFGAFAEVRAVNRKISDLEIESEDYSSMIAKTRAGVWCTVTLDYLAQLPHRTIFINTDRESFSADLIRGRLEVSAEGGPQAIEHGALPRNSTYSAMHRDILFDGGRVACTYEQAREVLASIDLVRRADGASR
jgi:CMP-N,N'-diacetyllegionaminic acid synthase